MFLQPHMPADIQWGENAPFAMKVGMIPFRMDGEQVQFLLYKPKAKSSEEQGQVGYGVVRGTRSKGSTGMDFNADEARLMQSRTNRGEDITRARDLRMAAMDPLANAKKELEEEAGVARENVDHSFDLGELKYTSRDPAKGSYGIRFFACTLKDPDTLDAHMKQDAFYEERRAAIGKDGLGAQWHTLDEIKGLMDAGAMSRGYLPIIEALHGAIEQSRAQLPPPTRVAGGGEREGGVVTPASAMAGK